MSRLRHLSHPLFFVRKKQVFKAESSELDTLGKPVLRGSSDIHFSTLPNSPNSDKKCQRNHRKSLSCQFSRIELNQLI